MDAPELEYVGFWPRVWASLIDTVLLMLLISPLVTAIYGKDYWFDPAFIKGPADFAVSWVLPAIVVIVFWMTRQATPGKMAISARVVDAQTGQGLSTGQSIGRYLGYFASTLPLFMGLIWVGIDPRKQGWHDKLAGTVVVRSKARGTAPVTFENANP